MAKMRPVRRCGGKSCEASGRVACGAPVRDAGIGCCDVPFDGPNREPGAFDAWIGCGLLSLRGGRESGGRCTLGVSGYEAGGTF
jgi:hypothetical protein